MATEKTETVIIKMADKNEIPLEALMYKTMRLNYYQKVISKSF